MEGMPESSVLALSFGTNPLQKWRNLEQRDVVAFAERTKEPLLVAMNRPNDQHLSGLMESHWKCTATLSRRGAKSSVAQCLRSPAVSVIVWKVAVREGGWQNRGG